MELLLKLSAVAILASGICLVLKKNSPEMGLALAILVSVGSVTLIVELIRPILKFLEEAGRLGGLSGVLFHSLLKCLGIGVWSKIASEICKDSGQGAIGGSIDLAGAVCALYCALPILNTLIDMLEELI
ncbi:MAG: hypothetical protein E7420_00915 [Ruminococcaceae bacterium]|nr:hypothetical protein [Oscillospiraceae bacterium]